MLLDGSLWPLCSYFDGLASAYVDIRRGSTDDLGNFDDRVICAYAQIFSSGKEIELPE